MTDVVVVGGGIAGLVAARELAIGGLSVTLLEASAVLGGRVARHTVAGIELDAGVESFATRGGTVAAFTAELGLGDAIVTPNPAGGWLQRASREAVPLPKTGLLGIPGVPLARDVIAVIGARGAIRAELDALLPGSVASKEHNLGRLVRRRMGRRVLDELVAPIVTGIHSRHPDELDVDAVAPGLRQALLHEGSLARAVLALRDAAPAGSAVAGIDGGIYRLVQALRADLDEAGVTVRTGVRVSGVDRGQVTLDGGEVRSTGHVVLAARLRTEPAGQIELAGEIVLATLVVDSPELDAAPRGTGLLVAAGAPGIRAKALTHSTAKWSWLAERAGSHRHVLRLSYNNVPADGLQEQARADAEKLLGVRLAPETVAGFARVAWPLAAGTARLIEGVTRVGESVSGTGLAAVIAHAKRQSGSLLKDLAG